MKKVLVFMLLLVIGLSAMAQQRIQNPEPQWTGIISDRPESFQTQLISSTENSIKVNVTVPGFYTTTVTTPKGVANVITVPKSVSTAQAGEPDMPMTGIPVMIGDKANMNVRVIDAQYIDYENVEVAPSKGDFPRSIDPATVPYTYGDCYRQDAFFPASNIGLYEPYIIRDIRGQNIVVYPFAYNPVTKTLRVYYNMTVEMYKMDNHGTNVISTRRSNTVKLDPDFKSVYQRHFINYEAGMSRYTPLDEEGDLLIICHDNFISSMTDFVNWKRTRGINTTIVGTSTAGSTYSAIKTYIQNQYNANNNLTHVLLVGDVDQIPGYPFTDGGSSWSGKGDNEYGQIVGNDIYNDIIIGRFSASSAAQVTTQVNRTITYEKELTTSATWCQNGLGISASAGTGGHNSEDDYQHIENLRTDLLNYGYSTVYQDYSSVSGYPSSSTTTISNHINSGVGIINYCNHGEETGWQSHYYMNSNVNALTNNNKLPFIFSVACLVGKYDYSSGDCFAETWMHATNSNTPTGAIGGAFSYISQPWIPPMWAQDEFVDILVESYNNNIKRSLGGAAINGMLSIFDHYNPTETSAVGCYKAWVIYGDPTLMMRTKTPQAMTVTHTGNLPLGSTTYNVTVSNGNGAVATITDANHNILGKATVSNGSATINISGNLTPNEELTLCVFGYNKVTYLGTITVIATGEQYTISANVNPTAAGSVSGTGTYYENSNCTLTATANSGYGFTNWTQNGSQVSTNPSYTFTVTGDATYTANFHQLEQHQITYTAQQSHGTISASSTVGYAGDIITLTATPDLGYSLDQWTVTSGSETIPVENNQFTMPDNDVTVSATFKSEPLTVANGTGTNNEVPFYGLYADDNYQHTQTIYPASMLTNMQGCQITKLTYYLSSSVTKSLGSTFQVRFGITTSTAFSSGTVNYISLTDAAVYSGTLSVDGTTVEFDFSDNPYLYSGGNLVVDVRITALGSGYNSMSFYGESGSTYYSVKSRSTSSLPTTSGTGVSFMPKITFAFTAPTTDPYISLTPNSATILTGSTQPLTATYGNVSGTPGITYISSNTNVATVNGNGNTATVTAVAPGTATITASMTYNGTAYTATCAITVEDPSYCEPSFSSPSDDYISNFATTGGITNIDNTSTYESNGYSDFYSTQSASIAVGETLSCTVTPSSTQWKYGHAIWVDWNRDYEFTSDERVAYTTSTATGSWTGSVAVPANANGGDYRMRVIHYYNQASPSDPCVSGQYGEAEDYKLTVITGGTQYTIAATASPTEGGTVTGAGQYYENTQCTLNATPNANYAFANWTKDGAVVSTNATYSFTVTEDASYVANFDYINTVKIMPNDLEYGSVAFGGNRETLTYDFEDGWQGWTAVQGTEGTSPHNWMHNTEYSAYSSNGNVIDLTTSGYNSSAGFMLSESYISAATSGGTATGAVYPDNYLISPQIRLGGTMTFYASGRTTDCQEKFTVMVSTTGTNISDFTNTSFTVTLNSQTYTQYTVDLSEYSGMGYVVFHHYDCTDQHLLKIDNITIVEGEVADGSVTASYVNGTSCTVVATPNEGYHLATWTENGNVVSTSATYTFTVTSDRELVANFTTASCDKILVDADHPTKTWDFEGDAEEGGYVYNSSNPNLWTGVTPACWDYEMYTSASLNQIGDGLDTVPQVYRSFNTTDGGHYSLRMHYKALLTMPELDENVDLGKIRLSMYVRQSYWRYQLQIGVVTADGTFYPVAVVNNPDKTKTYFDCGFESVRDLEGEGRRIAFKNFGSNENDPYAVNYLDDIKLTYVGEEPLSCLVSPGTVVDFEGMTNMSGATGVEPKCWEVITSDVTLTSTTKPQLYRGLNSTEGGNYSLRMMNRCVYAMPEFDGDYSIQNLTMTFKLRQPNSMYRLQVGVVDEQGTFHPVKTVKSGTTMEAKTVSFANYTGSGRIAFRNTLVPGTGMSTDYLDYSYNYIDDINFTLAEEDKIEASDENVMAIDLEDIAVYPNPTTDYLNVECTMNNVQSVEMIDVYGKVVRTDVGANNYSPTQINVSGLAAGMYFVRVTTDRGAVTKPFVKR